MKAGYSDSFDANEQISMEEKIASIIFDDPEVTTDADTADMLAEEILYIVLRDFRPDLFDDHRVE